MPAVSEADRQAHLDTKHFKRVASTVGEGAMAVTLIHRCLNGADG